MTEKTTDLNEKNLNVLLKRIFNLKPFKLSELSSYCADLNT